MHRRRREAHPAETFFASLSLSNMDMLQEDQDTLERLKAKYNSSAGHSTLAKDAAADVYSQGEASLPNIRLCQVCQGSGMKTEVYEFRRLESACTHCHGESILKVGGRTACQQQQPLATAALNVASQHCSIRGSHPPQQQSDTSSKTGSASHDSKRHSRGGAAKLDKLQQKVKEMQQEEADLQAAIDSQASNPQQRELEAELLQQLQCHLASLRKQQQQLTARSDSVS